MKLLKCFFFLRVRPLFLFLEQSITTLIPQMDSHAVFTTGVTAEVAAAPKHDHGNKSTNAPQSNTNAYVRASHKKAVSVVLHMYCMCTAYSEKSRRMK